MKKARKDMIVNNTIIGAMVFNTNEDISKIKRALVNKIEGPSLMELSNSIETASCHELMPVPMRHYKTKLCSLDYSTGKVSIRIKPTTEPGITYNTVILYTYDAGCYVKTYKMLGIYNMPSRVKLTEKGTMTFPIKVNANTKPKFRDMALEGWCNAWAFATKEDFKAWYSYEDNKYQLYGGDIIYVTEDYGDGKKEYSSLWEVEDEDNFKTLDKYLIEQYKQLNTISRNKRLLATKEEYISNIMLYVENSEKLIIKLKEPRTCKTLSVEEEKKEKEYYKDITPFADKLTNLRIRLKDVSEVAITAQKLYEREAPSLKHSVLYNNAYIEALRKRRNELKRNPNAIVIDSKIEYYYKKNKQLQIFLENDKEVVILTASDIEEINEKACSISEDKIESTIRELCNLNDKLVRTYNRIRFEYDDKSYDFRYLSEFIQDIQTPRRVVENIKAIRESISIEDSVLKNLANVLPEMDDINSRGTCSILE